MKQRKNLFSSLVIAILASYLFVGCSRQKSEMPPAPKEPKTQSTAELKAIVDKLLESADNVMIRRSIDDVFELVDRLVEAKREDDALRYLSCALQHNAWALDYQLLNARLLQARGETRIPQEVAALVLQYAERDTQVNRARELLHQEPIPRAMPLQPISDNSITIVLVPIGETDVCVLEDLRRRLAERLGVSVLVKNAGVTVPGYKRDPFELAMSEKRERLRACIKQDYRAKVFLEQAGITNESLDQTSVVENACRRLVFASEGTNALAQFDAHMAQLKKLEKQWDIDEIDECLQLSVAPFLRENVYFIGITTLDVFREKSNFLFHISEISGHYSVMSYRRFTADFNQETPNRKRLVERMLKSSLACVGFLLGVPRCSAPTCARAYPHNLRELDASSILLCPACQEGFQKVLNGMPDSTEEDQKTD